MLRLLVFVYRTIGFINIPLFILWCLSAPFDNNFLTTESYPNSAATNRAVCFVDFVQISTSALCSINRI